MSKVTVEIKGKESAGLTANNAPSKVPTPPMTGQKAAMTGQKAAKPSTASFGQAGRSALFHGHTVGKK